MMRVIVAGGRDFDNKSLLSYVLGLRLSPKNTVIISGGAKGADKWGEAYAKKHGIPVEVYPADWKRFGKSAGYRRNTDMALVATHLIAFWDGKSRGTRHMIDIATSKGLNVEVVRYWP